MADATIPAEVSVPMGELAGLAVEWWRLSRAVGEGGGGAARHALRKMEDFLRARKIEAQSLEGTTYDAGMAATVLDVIDDPGMKRGEAVVEQTVSPLVFWNGKVVKAAEVVTRRGK
jgi:hypothetical protein